MRCEPIDAPQNFSEIRARPPTADLACQICGCTDSTACPGGCSWVSINPPICSACAGAQASGDIDDETGILGLERCPASEIPAPHAALFTSETEWHCVRCRQGFFT